MSQLTASTQPVIMQVIPELSAGGAEQGCIDVAAGLVKAQGKAVIASNGGFRLPDLARIGADHIDLPVHSKNPIVMTQNVLRLSGSIKEYGVNIIHARSRAPAWSAWHAAKRTGARFVTTCHAPYNISSGAKRFYNSSISKGELIIAISNYVAEYLVNQYHVPPEKIRLIHRGIPMERFHPTAVTPERMIQVAKDWRIPDGANIVLLPGRLTRWKGHSVLVEAMSKLARDDVFAVIIGDDQGRSEYRKELESEIHSLGLESRVRMIDHCHDMPAAYMLATVVVSASTDPEGFGRVAVEGQAMGRPTIATDHGGARETILRGETGWLIPPGDSGSLAQAINEALSLDASQRAVLATRTMAHVAHHFTKEQMVNRTLDVYAELLADDLRKNLAEAAAANLSEPFPHRGPHAG